MCKQIVQTSTLRDVDWATHNCTLAFTSLGAWPEGADGTDVNSMAVSNNSPKLLVTADDFGKVSSKCVFLTIHLDFYENIVIVQSIMLN